MLAEVGDMRRVLSQPYLAGLCNGHSSETIRIGQSDRRYIDVTRPEVHVLLRQNEQLNNTRESFAETPISFPELG